MFIDQKEYWDQFRILATRYYGDVSKYAKEYYEKIHEYLEGIKELYEQASSAAQGLINDKLDEYNEQLEKSRKVIEDEQKAVEDAQKAKIDAVQEEIDTLDKANEKRRQNIDLQQKMYELERSKNQRNRLVYTSGEGFIYQNDPKAIREAEQGVEDAKFNIRKSKLEDELEDLNNGLDATTKHYEELIEQNEKYYKSLTDPLEEYLKKFEELMELEEKAQNMATLESLGYSVDSILAMDEETFESFKTNYLGVLGSLYQNDELMLKALNEKAGQPLGDYLTATKEMTDNLNALSLSTVSEGINSSYMSLIDFNDGLAVTLELLQTIAETTPTALPIIGTAASVSPANAHSKGTVGNAFADGTHYNGLSSAESGALRSEYGQPELTVYPNGTYELTTTPTISDLPKGTVIFDENQTNRILKGNKKSGHAFANGTNFKPLSEVDPEKYAMLTAFNNLEGGIDTLNNTLLNTNSLIEKSVLNNISNTNSSSTVINGGINITCPGVTSQEVMENIGKGLQKEFEGLSLVAYQRSLKK